MKRNEISILHVKLHKELSKKFTQYVNDLGTDKSSMIRIMLTERLKKEGYIKNPN